MRPQWIGPTRAAVAACAAVACLAGRTPLLAQRGQQPAATAPPAQSPRAVAPTDLTGYWVAVVTEDWRWRMVTPPKGDFSSLPLNAEGRRVANQWDPASDIKAGEQCRAFGAAGVMHGIPIRLHVTWQDENTLKMEIDNGTQTRLFHFDPRARPPARPDWQGFSVATWETSGEGQGQTPFNNGPGGQNTLRPGLSGSLRVVTTRMRPGYLRRNGVPYSGNAKLTEFFDRTMEPNGGSWLVDTSVLEDPEYYDTSVILTTHFKREADGSKFQPRPCEVTPPVTGTPARGR
jgi:hypothetical protein